MQRGFEEHALTSEMTGWPMAQDLAAYPAGSHTAGSIAQHPHHQLDTVMPRHQDRIA